MKTRRRAFQQPDRTAWWHVLVSLLLCLVVLGSLVVLDGSEIEIQIGRLISVICLVLGLKWGYWRNRR